MTEPSTHSDSKPPTPTPNAVRVKSQYIKDLCDKNDIASPFLVKFSSVSIGKTGKPYLNLVLMDKTGELEAKLWDDVSRYASQVVQDAFIWVKGRCQLYQGRKQIVVKSVEVLREDEVQIDQYLLESRINPEPLYQKLLSFVESMEDPDYRALAQSILRDDPEIVEKLKLAPAAKSVHHAYRSGLLEHIVSISSILDALASHYGSEVNRDLLLLGGFFHDIAKLWELSYGRVTDYTDEGRLVGHLVMGVELIDRKIRGLESSSSNTFPEEKKLLVKHLILSHHGKLEYGSPKRPKCLEALIVHYIDDLDSKVNSIRTFIEADQNPGKWTGFHRGFERFFYKPEWARTPLNS